MILQGDCRVRMAEMEENSVDAIVTDPPYELGFMGKSWDASGIAYDLEVWRQAFRVLKPGGYLLAFGGTRTYHRLAVAIEDAGFVLHPMIGWCFGSGFPKATNLSKMLDKHRRRDYVKAAIDLGINLPGRSIDDWTKEDHAPGEKWWGEFKKYLSPDDWGRIERAVTGSTITGKSGWYVSGEGDITAPATDAARQWDGWYYGRQSLKPALEPVCMAQKPPEGRMVDNVLRWGCGAINVDASRIGTEDDLSGGTYGGTFSGSRNEDGSLCKAIGSGDKGRWPSNLVLGHAPGCVRRGEKKVRGVQKAAGSLGFGSDRDDNYKLGTGREYGPEETVADWDCAEGCPVRLISEQSGHLKSGAVSKRHKQAAEPGGGKRTLGGSWHSETKTGEWEKSEGTAARFFLQIDPDPIFYCAKASRAERNRGLEGLPTREAKTTQGLNSPEMRAARGRQAKETHRQNHHPTIKPLKLMRYLVRLVTPPGGVVLDPFAGSGTTLVAAKEEGFQYIGIELEPEYVEIAEARLAAAERPPATLEDFK